MSKTCQLWLEIQIRYVLLFEACAPAMKRELFASLAYIPILLPLEILYDLMPRIWNSGRHNTDIMSIVPRYDETNAMAAPGFIVAIERGTPGYLPLGFLHQEAYQKRLKSL